MPQIVCNISLDVAVNDSGLCLTAKSGDCGSRLLSVRFTDHGQPMHLEGDASVLLNISKGEQRKSFEGSVQPSGEALFVLPVFLLESAGVAKCDVSVVDLTQARLTTACFAICVEESVCPDATASPDAQSDVVSRLLASEKLHVLAPVQISGTWALAPSCNRKYLVDLSDAKYQSESGWQPFRLILPSTIQEGEEGWVLLYCHAPADTAAGPIVVDWGRSESLLFADGIPPTVALGDFDIVCTYSHVQKKWQIGVVQYGQAEASV